MSSGGNGHALAPAYAAAVRDVRYHSVACSTFLVWHCFLTFDEDVQYIWTMRNKNFLKWIYFFLRYVVIFACIMHNWVIELLANGSNPPILCKIWYIYTVGLIQILAVLLEIILAMRVYALYNRSSGIACLLSALILTEVGGTLRLLLFPRDVGFYQTCLLLQINTDGKDQSIIGFIVHCVLIGLTMFKYLFVFRAGRNRPALVSLVVRDGGIMYGTIVFFVLSVLVLCRLENERTAALFFWIVSLFSISGCRMILSMERFARKEIAIAYPMPILTSRFSIGPLDSRSRRQDQPTT